MINTDFYDRPLVVRIREIFGNPTPPAKVTEAQFDDFQDYLEKTASKPWHEIDQEDYWHYLLDLKYQPLQQDLFDYLFPAFLIKWWEGMQNRTGGPEAETDFYAAIDGGNVINQMMNNERQKQVLHWMVDAYMDSVDSWSGHLSVSYSALGPDDLHGPLRAFNALGQSVPITRAILEGLSDLSSVGRAQWWLVFCSGIIWEHNKCPAVQPWTMQGGGGGIYATFSDSSIYTHGYLPENLSAFCELVSYDLLVSMLEQTAQILPTFPHGEWAMAAWEKALYEQQLVSNRLDLLKSYLSLPELGGLDSKL